jgi:hypothetical protein
MVITLVIPYHYLMMEALWPLEHIGMMIVALTQAVFAFTQDQRQ